jgi:hypothetical protein
MTQTKRTLYKAIWAFLLFILVSPFIIGQRLNSFSGDYGIGTYKGKAEYTYHVVGIDTILDGSFKMERSNLEALLKENDSSFSINGSFEEGLPQGNWLFQFGEFYTDSTAQVSGFQYRVNVNGILQEAKGEFIQGKPNGKWRFSHKKIKDSQILDTLFFSEVNFLDGVPQQSFNIQNPQGVLVGRFLRSGLAHDTWSLFSDEAENIENWYFNEGRLERIENDNDGNIMTTSVFGTPFIESKTINLDKGFSTLVSIYMQSGTTKTIDATKGINALLVENSANYEKIDAILSELGSTEFLAGFKVKAPYFPMDSESAKQLDSIVRSVKSSKKLSDGYLENTRLNLLKRSDEEAKALYHTVVVLDSSFLRPLQLLTELKDLGVIENLSGDMLGDYLFPQGVPTIPLSIPDGKGGIQSYSGPDKESFDFEKQGMEGYLEMATFVSKSLNQIAEALGQKLKDDRQEQEFILLEEQMIAQANGLNKFTDSIRQQLGKLELKALDNIKLVAEKLLSDYAELPAADEKLNQARMLITCLLHFDALSKEIVRLPEKSRELEEKYKDAVWNPFTATIMDEMVKKRITSAYKNVALPYALGKVEKDLNCDNAEELKILFKDLHLRMLELRDEDTSKLERKLRKERNPEVVLQLFNIKPLAK